MAHREHRPSHVLFTRPCGRCGRVFDYCGSCQPGRLYCGEACSIPARKESLRKAHVKYNDRDSKDGRRAHRLEEADRRERRARERVGDHRIQDQTGSLQVPASAAYQAAVEASDAVLAPAAPTTLGTSGPGTEPWVGAPSPGRLYCGEACSEESSRRTRSEDSREAHRLVEADRCEQRARARERVGNHRIQDQMGRLQVPASAAYQPAAEASDAALVAPADPPTLCAPKPYAPGTGPRAGAPAPASTEWVLVAWPGLLRAARRRLGTKASCPFCGRHGRIARVVSLDHWRRRVRYGLE